MNSNNFLFGLFNEYGKGYIPRKSIYKTPQNPYEKIFCNTCNKMISRCNMKHHKLTKKHKIKAGEDDFLFNTTSRNQEELLFSQTDP